MSFFTSISDFFSIILGGSSSDVSKKHNIRKIEAELKAMSPVFYKNHQIFAPFPESLIILHQNSPKICKVLEQTILNNTNNISSKYIDLLLSTGFSTEMCANLKKLDYNVRKEALRSAEVEKKELDMQNATLNAFIKGIQNSKQMEQIDIVISKLFQFYDICSFGYDKFIQEFAPEYGLTASKSMPMLRPVNLVVLEQRLLDLYYVLDGFVLTGSVYKAFLLLAEQIKAAPLTEEESNEYTEALKKISVVLTRYVNTDIISKLLCVIKNDPEYKPAVNKYEHEFLQNYINLCKQMFAADTQRIASELKDERLCEGMQEIFNGKELLEVNGYNNETNAALQKTCAQMFMWTTPLQILKSFVHYYMSPDIMELLNNIVVEGLFSNANIQQTFGANVFHCSGIMERIHQFEKSFENNGENDISSIFRMAANSKSSQNATDQLTKRMSNINARTKNMLQEDMTKILRLCNNINDMFADTKKGSPDLITNVKMMLYSTRNRNRSRLLESQFIYWQKFTEFMKNYVVFTDKE